MGCDLSRSQCPPRCPTEPWSAWWLPPGGHHGVIIPGVLKVRTSLNSRWPQAFPLTTPSRGFLWWPSLVVIPHVGQEVKAYSRGARLESGKWSWASSLVLRISSPSVGHIPGTPHRGGGGSTGHVRQRHCTTLHGWALAFGAQLFKGGSVPGAGSQPLTGDISSALVHFS